MSRKGRTIAGLLGLILLSSGVACSSRYAVPGYDGEPTAPEGCFKVSEIDSFSPLHERYVYVRDHNGKHYLLTLDASYSSLPFVSGIKIYGAYTRVCTDSGARITFTDAGYVTYARIVRVESVPSKEEAERLVKERLTPVPKG